ncbi:thioredoxin family protein [Paenibacillus polysaccharolyticus]|uniref:thioredoxin family protein n=1 Tax=Paenibacillus polysaccharolyticus TaxID=582692 RepID=UPI00334015B9
MNLTLYYSNDCGHCRRFQKTLDKIAQERQHVSISKIEYDSSIHTEVKFIPTVIVKHGDRELGRFSSALAKKSIDVWLDQLEGYIKSYLG